MNNADELYLVMVIFIKEEMISCRGRLVCFIEFVPRMPLYIDI